MTSPTSRVEAAALALAAHGRAPQDGKSVQEQVAALWADEETRFDFLAQAEAVIKAARHFDRDAANARIGTEVTVQHMTSSDETLTVVAHRHGAGALPTNDVEVNGTIQHLVSPIVGFMRLDAEDPWRIERLSLVLALLQRQEQERARSAARSVQGVAAVHTEGLNAEDCPGCSGTNPPYPFICPGDDRYRTPA